MSITAIREEIAVRRLASGAELRFPVFRFEGNPGKKVYIQANIHGPEIAGIGAIYDLIAFLQKQNTLNGSITLVPSVNPVGLDLKHNSLQIGYADPNENKVGNFNRIYQMLVTDRASDDPEDVQKVVLPEFVAAHRDSDIETIKTDFRQVLKLALADMQAKRGQIGMRYGMKLALIVQKMSYDADYLIDLHTASDAVYHMYTFEQCLPSVRYFNLQHAIQLPSSFNGVLDESFLLPWVRLQKAFGESGREIPFGEFDLEAFTPELGSSDTLSREAMQEDCMRVVNYLRYKGVLAGDVSEPEGKFHYCLDKDYQVYFAPTGGLLTWHVDKGDPVKAGDPLATIIRPYDVRLGDPHPHTETVVRAARDGIVINRSKTQVVHEGMSVCRVITRLLPLPV